MTLELSWLHCLACCKSFEHHARVIAAGDDLEVASADVVFSFTSCGHFLCEACISEATVANVLACPVCGTRGAEAMALRPGRVPVPLAVFLRTPQGLVEDALSAMAFQLGSGSRLIRSLRAKVAQQKDILTKAKRELAAQRQVRDKLAEVQRENAALRKRLADVSMAASSASYAENRSVAPAPYSGNRSVAPPPYAGTRSVAPSPAPYVPNRPPAVRVPASPVCTAASPMLHRNARLSLRSPMLAMPLQYAEGSYAGSNYAGNAQSATDASSPLRHAMAATHRAPERYADRAYASGSSEYRGHRGGDPSDLRADPLHGSGRVPVRSSSRSSLRTPPRHVR